VLCAANGIFEGHWRARSALGSLPRGLAIWPGHSSYGFTADCCAPGYELILRFAPLH
jgi:hypothetical protein